MIRNIKYIGDIFTWGISWDGMNDNADEYECEKQNKWLANNIQSVLNMIHNYDYNGAQRYRK